MSSPTNEPKRKRPKLTDRSRSATVDDSETTMLRAQLAAAEARVNEEAKRRAEAEELAEARGDALNNAEDALNRHSIEKMVTDGVPQLHENAKQKPHEDKNRYKVISEDKLFVTTQDLDGFDVNTVDGETRTPLQSSLMGKLQHSTDGRLTYQNEATIQGYVQSLIQDALLSMTCEKSLQVFAEMSIFSLRPDLIVVMHPSLGVVLVVEVKNPGDDVFKSNHIAGQIFDYLNGMKRLGHSTPFVVLSSFEKMALARLGGRRLEKKYHAVVRDSVEVLQKAGGKHDPKGLLKGEQKKPDSSPGGKCNPGDPGGQAWIPKTPKTKIIARKGNEKASNKKEEALVCYSEVFGLDKVFKAMMLAIECGIQSLATVDENLRDCLPRQGETLKVDLPIVGRTYFKWQQCSQKVDYEVSSSNRCVTFYLLSELGTGRSGKVFLACDRFGRTCALKFYLEKAADWESFNAKDRMEANKRSRKLAETKVKKEIARWKALNDEFKGCVAEKELNNMVVLKMPYFAAIPPDKRLDKDVLTKIKILLEKFESKGYRYREVRWQHVGCSKNERDELVLTMLDMESLESKEDVPASIRTQIKELIRRSSDSVIDKSVVEELLKKIGFDEKSS